MYKCKRCQYLFDTDDGMKRHAAMCAHRVDMFRCDMCNKTFRLLEDRAQHFQAVGTYLYRVCHNVLVFQNTKHIYTIVCYSVFSVFCTVWKQKEEASYTYNNSARI